MSLAWGGYVQKGWICPGVGKSRGEYAQRWRWPIPWCMWCYLSNRMTDACENFTFQQILLHAVINNRYCLMWKKLLWLRFMAYSHKSLNETYTGIQTKLTCMILQLQLNLYSGIRSVPVLMPVQVLLKFCVIIPLNAQWNLLCKATLYCEGKRP